MERKQKIGNHRIINQFINLVQKTDLDFTVICLYWVGGNSAVLDYNINLENLPFPIPKVTNLRVFDLDRIDQRVFKTLQHNGKLELKSNEIMIVEITVEK